MARGRGRVGIAAFALSLITAGCTDDGSSRPAGRSPDTTASASEVAEGLEFGECGNLIDPAALDRVPADRADHLTIECGVLDVPLDYDDLNGEQLGVQVVRIRDDRQADHIGTLVLGPGGPGQSGLSLAPSWASAVSDQVLRRFDMVTLDPRGVAASAGFNCPPTSRDEEPTLIADLLTPEGWADAAESYQEASAACIEELGADRAGGFGTVAAAHDLDLLREAVGDDQLTFVGFSYGAKLGAEYARQFPDRVRAVVLDGPSHPADDSMGIVERQAAGFEDALGAWAADCPARPTCERIGDDPIGFVRGLMKRAREFPIPSGRPQGDPATGDGDVISGLAALLKSQQSWPVLDDALAEMALGDSGTLREVIERGFGGGDDAPYDERDANMVINCTDARPAPAKADVLRSARRLAGKYPVFGKAFASFLVSCTYWGGEREVLPVPEQVGAAPIVVVGTRHDAATPYAGAVAMARILGSGHLLTWEGHSHTAYLQSSCITDAVDAYLVELEVPAKGTTCPP
ncbi:alpha/beta fold hydrolase [Nocardioides agariphilus]|uniref:Alpha/beta fold hydrolase n=1 Tax=Nocardioides agariphilus TaxID=433664 RepID=A0A930VPM9_9ACTN|nr:alpha/beta hydrolase [Nocardioides agariphilus]MBF4770507.1 alpha/beta fold hydrolase [Nocardioides agariphilus]